MDNVLDMSDTFRPRPKPETVIAKLWCDSCDKPKWHSFHHAREVELKTRVQRVFNFVFECNICNTCRDWGSYVERL